MSYQGLGMGLFDAISAEDDHRFYQQLSKIEDLEELNAIHHVYTPLGLACNFDRSDFARALLEKGAAVNCRIGDTQQSPVHLAAKGDNKGIKCMRLLKEFGADLNAQDSEGNTPLHHACTMENVILFDFLMANGASVNLINSFEETPLIRAIISQNEYFIRCLVTAGYDVNFPNGTPLEYLTRQQPTMMESINLFISKGAHIHEQRYLSTAAAYGNLDMMLLLKEKGVDLNIDAVSGIMDFTPLHYACDSTKASHKCVMFLLQWGAGVNVESVTRDTPLHLACKQSNLKKVLALLNYGANVNARNEKLSTPLRSLLMTRFPGMDDNLRDFYQIFNVLKGARVPLTDDELELFKRIVPVTLRELESEEHIFNFLQEIEDYAHEPGTLMDLCRGVIRNSLTPKLSESIALLPLPVYLKHFLLLKDII